LSHYGFDTLRDLPDVEALEDADDEPELADEDLCVTERPL